MKVEGKIYPPRDSKIHWKERFSHFGITIEDYDCYEQITKKVTPHLKELLKWDGWSECEKMILESWENK